MERGEASETTGVDLVLSLRAWVDWLIVAYELVDEWPECWYRHKAAVNELLALQQWHAAALGEQPAASQLALWHDGLARVRDRAIRPLLQSCHATGHVDPTPEQTAQRQARREQMATAAGEFWATAS